MNRQYKNGWVRAAQPLFWWLLLVLALYGIRLNQRLLEQTRLFFTVSLNGEPLPYPVTITWDGRPLKSGDNIQLGNHCFAVTGSKTASFSTNLSIWYGKHDLGEIRLTRGMGRLSVKADPPAEGITISGPEFSTNLQDSPGMDLKVPTDSYNVGAQYRRWSGSQTASVTEDEVSPVTFSPKFGAVDLTCNRDGATFQLQNASGQVIVSDNLPSVVGDLPVGDYQVTALYHSRTMQKSIHIEAGMTNDVAIQFVLGAVQLETTPPGAEVRTTDGSYLGQTPLLAEMPPQETQFNLSLGRYESASVTLKIAADQTSFYRTNLVGVGYESSMREAKIYLAESNYEAAAQAAAAALSSKPGDVDALAIQDEAGKYLDAKRQEREKVERPKKWFDNLCSEYPYTGLFTEHKLQTAKPAADVTEAIVAAFTNSPNVFKIMRRASPETNTYEIMAKQTDFLGVNERDCLIVVGSPSDADTEIRFKVLEFEIVHHLTGDNGLIPLSQTKVENNSLLQWHVQQGLQIVTDKIQKAIAQ